ncbi:hypothetical protein F5Y19DRAFT_127322 [Xylariaceae sp. FL1651]|nr:hypothetical protein F5Y19DRAFT_127322 [Xylariaceae sp. FL1651]
MSSMLKKTGGLSFKPKASRRPGGAPSRPPTSSVSASTTRAPTDEPRSHTSTPAASNPPTPAIAESIETGIHELNKPLQPSSAEHAVPASQQTPSEPEPRIDIPAIRPTQDSTISPPETAQHPNPQQSNNAIRPSSPRAEQHSPASDRLRQDEQPIPNPEGEEDPLSISSTVEVPAASHMTPIEPLSTEEAALGPPTAPPSPPPVADTIVAAPTDESSTPQPPARKKQAPRRRNPTATDGETDAEGSAPRKKRQRRKSNAPSTVEAGESTGTEVRQKTRRRKRNPTPEDAESLTVDHSTMKVGDLTKDLGIGKRFKHADEIEQRAREARARHRLKKLEREKRKHGLLPTEDDDSASQAGTPADGSENRRAAMAQIGAAMESGAGQGVGYDVVDGQIVVHAASLIVDRHNQDMSTLEVVEENEFTNLINSASFAKRVQGPGSWTDEETDKFYRLLGMFGTDFETISRLFPGKNRRAIKLKFNKEERLRPNRVNAAMMVRGEKKVNIDIEEYKATQRQWQAKDKILAEHAKLAEEHEREVSRLREERRAAGLIDDDENDAAAHTNENSNVNNSNSNEEGDREMEVIEEDADELGQGGQEEGEDNDADAQPEGIDA